ncbi:MAG: bifunctional 3,4-dihydroxy-2-butanone-4-phosphate synthase/GTP cyclohydrolase II [Patescibacteria group bacterium]
MDSFNTIEAAIEAIRKGEMIIVVDDENRENEGDLVMAAEHATVEKMAFIIRRTGGVVCLSLDNIIADRLDLPPMVARNTSKRETPFTVSIEAAEGVDTGISAADRVKTILTAIDGNAKPADLSRPGHVFPLRAQNGGVLWRGGHTEASVDLCRMAKLKPAAIISELMHDDGKMMRFPALVKFAKEHNLIIVSVADIIAYRRRHEKFIELVAETDLQTKTGVWQMRVYRDLLHDLEHVALVKGLIDPGKPTLARVHSQCLTGDLFDSMHCDCGGQLQKAMKQIEEEGSGVLLYMEQEGRGIGLINKVKAYELQHKKGLDTVEANQALGFPEDLREYGIGAQILVDLGLQKVRLMTNNPKKMGGIEGYGLEIVEQMPLEVEPNGVNRKYLQTKKEKLGHTLRNV